MKLTIETRQKAIDSILEAAKQLTSEFLTREDLVAFAGNTISIGYLANLDCKGQGPEGGFNLGRKKVYPKHAGVEWLIGRVRV